MAPIRQTLSLVPPCVSRGWKPLSPNQKAYTDRHICRIINPTLFTSFSQSLLHLHSYSRRRIREQQGLVSWPRFFGMQPGSNQRPTELQPPDKTSLQGNLHWQGLIKSANMTNHFHHLQKYQGGFLTHLSTHTVKYSHTQKHTPHTDYISQDSRVLFCISACKWKQIWHLRLTRNLSLHYLRDKISTHHYTFLLILWHIFTVKL